MRTSWAALTAAVCGMLVAVGVARGVDEPAPGWDPGWLLDRGMFESADDDDAWAALPLRELIAPGLVAAFEEAERGWVDVGAAVAAGDVPAAEGIGVRREIALTFADAVQAVERDAAEALDAGARVLGDGGDVDVSGVAAGWVAAARLLLSVQEPRAAESAFQRARVLIGGGGVRGDVRVHVERLGFRVGVSLAGRGLRTQAVEAIRPASVSARQPAAIRAHASMMMSLVARSADDRAAYLERGYHAGVASGETVLAWFACVTAMSALAGGEDDEGLDLWLERARRATLDIEDGERRLATRVFTALLVDQMFGRERLLRQRLSEWGDGVGFGIDGGRLAVFEEPEMETVDAFRASLADRDGDEAFRAAGVMAGQLSLLGWFDGARSMAAWAEELVAAGALDEGEIGRDEAAALLERLSAGIDRLELDDGQRGGSGLSIGLDISWERGPRDPRSTVVFVYTFELGDEPEVDGD